MVEFMHDEGQIHPIHPGMITPSFPKCMGTVISPQARILADIGNNDPYLAAVNGLVVIMGPGIEEEVVIGVFLDIRISGPVFLQGFFDAVVDNL